ncbi:MAG: RagB/SusD family nutrient uptake outer membrane protein [Saprospiraceae bacterium]|nr:RagB/SusD family nutrient uptake outer membrane protein [Saprospiraceae bacterium]
MKYFNIKIKLRFVGVILAMTFFSVSCGDLLNEDPISEIGAASFWKSNADAQLGVAAIYDAMQGAYRLKHYNWGEFRSDNFSIGSASANANSLELLYNDVNSGNGGVVDWSDLYIMINRANLAIKYIPQIEGFNANLLAEAHALRAYAYFDAIRVWGGVPLFTEPVESSTQELALPKTDGATIMNDVVIPDMLKAEELMANIENKYRFTLTSIWCLQADIYMWNKDYANAKAALEKVIATNEFSLVTTPEAWQDLFLNDIQEGGPGKIMTGPELIFSIRFDLTESRDNPGQTRANRSGIFALFFAGLPSYHLSPVLERKWRDKFPIDSADWVAKYPDTDPILTQDVDADGVPEKVYGDWRYYYCRELGIDGIGSKLIGEARLAKYNKTNYSQDLDDSDIVLYRYAGILYTLAEIENILGNDDVALDIVNQIRTARQLPLVSSEEFGSTQDEREVYILDEKQLELLGEAERWWDLRRSDRAISTLNPILDTVPGGVILTPDRLLFPIFDDHLVENPNLEQNPGY